MSPPMVTRGAQGARFEPQAQLGKYPILRQIGRGATSHVYLARDPFADREVAIKVFLFDQQADPQTGGRARPHDQQDLHAERRTQ